MFALLPEELQGEVDAFELAEPVLLFVHCGQNALAASWPCAARTAS
ncbi:hypothetical protein AB0I53_38620 [Saccharopolyspora sp. NPDC050389]